MVKIDRDFMRKVYEYADQGYISRRQHPDYPELWIYNYTNACACDGAWDDVTKTCRGLILRHEDYLHDRDKFEVTVIARPFPKFFNHEEHIRHGWPIPNEPFETTEKVDGSLGIIFHYDIKWHVATRGSFDSEQAIKAREIMSTYLFHYGEVNYTYLAEIIYPDNRIVVNYGRREELVLLAIIDRRTGEDVAFDVRSPFTENEVHKVGFGYSNIDFDAGIATLKDEAVTDNREGVVIKFKSGVRIKVKFEQYVQLHRIMTGITDKRIWEGVRDGVPLTDAMKAVKDFPDEIFKDTEDKEFLLYMDYAFIECQAKNYYDKGPFTECFANSDRKYIAEYFKKYKHPTILFCMLDKKPYASFIWKLLRPRNDEN